MKDPNAKLDHLNLRRTTHNGQISNDMAFVRHFKYIAYSFIDPFQTGKRYIHTRIDQYTQTNIVSVCVRVCVSRIMDNPFFI